MKSIAHLIFEILKKEQKEKCFILSLLHNKNKNVLFYLYFIHTNTGTKLKQSNLGLFQILKSLPVCVRLSDKLWYPREETMGLDYLWFDDCVKT